MKELIFKILGLLLITLLKNAPPQAFLNASIAPINAKIWFKRTGAIPQIEKKKRKNFALIRHSRIAVLNLVYRRLERSNPPQ